jgi:phospho-N-acetylmuramoyl-pentapeptide-transferase
MLKWLATWLRQDLGGPGWLRLFDYLSVRTMLAALTTFVLSLVLGRLLIRWLHDRGLRDVVEDYGVIDVGNKRGTPTMGGVIIILAVLAGYLLWADFSNSLGWVGLAAMIWFGLLGMVDDLYKIRGGSGKAGLGQLAKLALQAVFAGLFLAWMLSPGSPVPPELRTQLYIPFMKAPLLDLGWLFVPFGVFTILAVSNSVNFADGMDGLATVPVAIVYMVYAVVAYVIGNAVYSSYLNFDFVAGSGEYSVLAGAVIGACLGFLWYNFFPAQVFMGDTGSMALGGLVAVMAIVLKQELLFLIAGGVFVVEGASVLIQEKIGIRWLGRRIFFRAPIHHAFQHRGVAETKVVIRFWIVAMLLGFIALLSLKFR